MGHMPLELQRFDVLFVSILTFSHLPPVRLVKGAFLQSRCASYAAWAWWCAKEVKQFYKIGQNVHCQNNNAITSVFRKRQIAEENYANKLGNYTQMVDDKDWFTQASTPL